MSLVLTVEVPLGPAAASVLPDCGRSWRAGIEIPDDHLIYAGQDLVTNGGVANGDTVFSGGGDKNKIH